VIGTMAMSGTPVVGCLGGVAVWVNFLFALVIRRTVVRITSAFLIRVTPKR